MRRDADGTRMRTGHEQPRLEKGSEAGAADLLERVGILGSAKLRQLDDTLRFALGLENG